jgi:hypothetical protein
MIRKRYLEALGASNLRSYVQGTIEKLLTSLHNRCADNLPVRVSQIAEEFQIEPQPRFDAIPADGQIRFVPELKKFVITLKRSNRQLPSSAAGTIESSLPSATARQRFTYAHEFAHRFFFVPGESGYWERAVSVAVRGAPPELANDALRKLIKSEEASCNAIARSLLVPRDLLQRAIGGTFPSSQNSKFLVELTALARMFKVSDECVFVRLQQARSDRDVAISPTLCALMIAQSEKVGAGQLSASRLRIMSSLLPERLHGAEIRPLFPGIRVDNLGEDLVNLAANVIENKRDVMRRATVPLMFTVTGLGTFTRQKVVLDGWYSVICRGNSNRAWIWGSVVSQ